VKLGLLVLAEIAGQTDAGQPVVGVIETPVTEHRHRRHQPIGLGAPVRAERAPHDRGVLDQQDRLRDRAIGPAVERPGELRPVSVAGQDIEQFDHTPRHQLLVRSTRTGVEIGSQRKEIECLCRSQHAVAGADLL
jgi:hypothetical protein